MLNGRPIRPIALAAFAVMLIGLWYARGIYDDKEALKYIGCAADLLRGDTRDLFGSYRAYGSYVLFLLPFVAFHVPWLAVVAQALLAVISAFALERLVVRVSGDPRVGGIAFVLVLLCYPFQQWVLALYSESFFASIALLFIERSTRPERPGATTYALAAVLLFARPVGILFVVPAFIWRWTGAGVRTSPAWVRPVAYTLLMILLLAMPVLAHHQLRVIVEGHVICGSPERPDATLDPHARSILDAQVTLFSHDPAYATGLAMRRMVSLFTLPRPYFSDAHNGILLVYSLLIPLAVLGGWRRRSHPLIRLLVAILVLNTVLIGLTYDEWNGRFLVPLWPVILGMAALGLGGLPGWFGRVGSGSRG